MPKINEQKVIDFLKENSIKNADQQASLFTFFKTIKDSTLWIKFVEILCQLEDKTLIKYLKIVDEKSKSLLSFILTHEKSEVGLSLFNYLDEKNLLVKLLATIKPNVLFQALSKHPKEVLQLIMQSKNRTAYLNSIYEPDSSFSLSKKINELKLADFKTLFELIYSQKFDSNKAAEIGENDFVLNSSLLFSQTPLHLAAIKNNIDLINFLINKKVIFREDEYQKTPLDYAIENKNFTAAVLLTSYLNEETYPKVLEKLDFGFLDLDAFESEKSVYDYCEKQQNIPFFILISFADFIQTHSFSLALKTTFISQYLQQIVSCNDITKKRALEINLAVFLFRLPQEQYLEFISNLDLDEELRSSLMNIICLFFYHDFLQNNSKKGEETRLYQFLKSQMSLELLTSTILASPKLHNFPASFLLNLAADSFLNTFQEIKRTKRSSILAILALTKESTPFKTADLEEEIRRFNNPKSNATLEEFQLFLNLARDNSVKILIKNLISKLDNPTEINRKLEAILNQFQKSQELIENSFLDDLLKEYVKKQHLGSTFRFNLSDMLGSLRATEMSDYLARTDNQTAIHLNALLSPNRCTSKNSNLASWLGSLEHKRDCLQLRSLQTINELEIRLDVLLSLFTNKDLVGTTTKLKESLIDISNYLFTIQFDSPESIWTDELNGLLAKLEKQFNDLKSKNNASLHHEFKHFLDSKDIYQLISDIKMEALEIDRRQKLNQQKYLEMDADELIKTTAIDLINNQPISDSKALAVQEKIYQNFQVLSNAFWQAIEDHPDKDKLRLPYFQWLFKFSSFLVPSDLALIEPRLKSIQAEDWKIIDINLTNNFDRLTHIQPFLSEFKRLISTPSFSMGKLFSFFKANKAYIDLFKAVCTDAKLNDVVALIEYAESLNNEALPEVFYYSIFIGTEPELWFKTIIEKIDYKQKIDLSMKVLYESSTNDSLGKIKAFYQKGLKLLPEAINLLLYKAPKENPKNILDTLTIIFKYSTEHELNSIISALDEDIISFTIEHAFLGLDDEDIIFSQNCRYLLHHLSLLETDIDNNAIQYIKRHLGKQDLSLLGDSQLQKIAVDVLKETNSLQDETFNGVWIQRLIESPQFVAIATPKILQNLIERYRLISLRLKQDEFTGLKPSINESSEEKEKRLKKKERLLAFKVDETLKALFIRLGDNCISYPERNVATKALDARNSFYEANVKHLEENVLFDIANSLASFLTAGKGDIAKAQSPILTFITKIFPNRNFIQDEFLKREKREVYLYNADGEKIGFLNKMKLAVSLEDEPKPLILSYPEGFILYDDKRNILGQLTIDSDIDNEPLFDSTTLISLLTRIPIDELEKNEFTLNLLIEKLLTTGKLKDFYPDCHPQLKTRIEQKIAEFDKPISAENLLTFIEKASLDSLSLVFSTIKQKDNINILVEHSFDSNLAREKLFKKENLPILFSLIEQQPSQFLATYLLKYYNRTWFSHGIALFAKWAKAEGQQKILVEALAILRNTDEKVLTESTYDRILHTLLEEENAKIIWTDFLEAFDQIQKNDSDLASDFSAFYFKQHCLPTIGRLNKMSDWQYSYSYRLILLIYAKQIKQLFPKQEFRYLEKSAWTEQALREMSYFVVQHMQRGQKLDENLNIAKKTLAKLVFRTANFGLIDLFYNEGQLNKAIFGIELERSLVNAIAAKDFLPFNLKTNIREAFQSVEDWFNGKSAADQKSWDYLVQNQAIIDWKKLSDETWEHNENLTSMPLITAFLMNYSGPKEPIAKLINDYISTLRTSTSSPKLYPLTKILALFPNKDISPCLFSNLIDLLTQKPKLMDKKIFHELAEFYLKTTGDKATSTRNDYALIQYFGLHKKYQLVQQAYKLLKTETKDNLTKTFKKAKKEAKVEAKLGSRKDAWYFIIYRFFMRLFKYGIIDKRSKMVTFCDEETKEPPISLPEKIDTEVLNGKLIAKQVAHTKKIQEFRQRHGGTIERFKSEQIAADGVKVEPLENLFSPGLSFFEKRESPLPTVVGPNLKLVASI
ncbi:MAG: ankyrin repeat domain-containing protein [Proteobacteria bacterium]|nr:ankyrin repeat domain-containing protein [Pseudomonadota bacterium]